MTYPELVASFVAETLKAHAKMLEGLIRNGCQVCGDPATAITQKPTWDLELTTEDLLNRTPALRVTGEYRIRCDVHADQSSGEAARDARDEP